MDPTVKEAMKLIGEACELLGWNIVLPEGKEAVKYLIMGTESECDRIAEVLEMDAELSANPGKWN